MRSLTGLSEIPAGSRIFIYGAGLGGGAVYGLLTAAGRGGDVAGFIETRPGGRATAWTNWAGATGCWPCRSTTRSSPRAWRRCCRWTSICAGPVVSPR
ncbi:MAG TPA: hypothetical protein VED40_05200 [Azospirillaceae bacterium]|nr:hypothetical protein [Azospirillaceae bacterium]